MTAFLQGLSVAYFRGIGSERQKLGPFKRFNFFVGANNSGKSTILDLLHRHLNNKREAKLVDRLDHHNGPKTGSFQFAIGIEASSFKANAIAEISERIKIRHRTHLDPHTESEIKDICKELSDGPLVWIEFDGSSSFQTSIKMAIENGILDVIPRSRWQSIWNRCTGSSGGSIEHHWAPELLSILFGAQNISFPEVRFIPTNREIRKSSEKFRDFSGSGLVDRLAELQSPDHDQRHELIVFNRINSFLQNVVSRPSARIEIPHNRQHVLVHMDDKVLPLSNLGTGIHEVIMIAAFCTISQESIVCIEEPENHLHPLLQRKLISYLQENTNNQYFVATHSPSLIETPSAAIFHVTNNGIQTYIKESVLRSDRLALCRELGGRASDIVQSNFVIWVEGPSDRLYLRHWIKALASDLEEGIHYSIMFYGGRLLSHLTADDDSVTEFIKLRSLNQNLCILMDSDKRSPRSKPNETKLRVQREMENGGAKAWITKGREIENYIPHDLLQAAVQNAYASTYHCPGDGSPFSASLEIYRKPLGTKNAPKNLETRVDKVKVAKIVCETEAQLDVLDLKVNVHDLVARIRAANL